MSDVYLEMQELQLKHNQWVEQQIEYREEMIQYRNWADKLQIKIEINADLIEQAGVILAEYARMVDKFNKLNTEVRKA